MSDAFGAIPGRDGYYDSLVDGERILFEQKTDELRRACAERIRELAHRRERAIIGNAAPGDIGYVLLSGRDKADRRARSSVRVLHSPAGQLIWPAGEQ